jgi:hypothetical protein
MRQLAVRQARPRQGLEGLTNLQALVELQALDLRGATVTNSIMQRLSALSALTQVRRCCSEAHCSSAQRCVCGCQVQYARVYGVCLPLSFALVCPAAARARGRPGD